MNQPKMSPIKHKQQVHQGPQATLAAVLQQLTGLSRAETYCLINMGGAYLGKRRCKKPSFPIKTGQEVSAFWRWPLEMKSIAFDPQWLIRDGREFLVASKPSGIPTQGHRDGDYMAFYEILKNHLPGYIGLHHRLDQDTSGLMLFSRCREINGSIATAFQKKQIVKKYLAICGPWQQPTAEITIDAPIAPLRTMEGTRQVVASHGKHAQTKVRRIEEAGGLTLIEAQPITGRTHQIRVHLSHLGLPLMGDTHYGSTSSPPFMLHCWHLAWPKVGSLFAYQCEAEPPLFWEDRLPSLLVQAARQWKGTSC